MIKNERESLGQNCQSVVTDESLRDVDLEPHPVPDLQTTVRSLHVAADRLHAGLDGEL